VNGKRWRLGGWVIESSGIQFYAEEGGWAGVGVDSWCFLAVSTRSGEDFVLLHRFFRYPRSEKKQLLFQNRSRHLASPPFHSRRNGGARGPELWSVSCQIISLSHCSETRRNQTYFNRISLLRIFMYSLPNHTPPFPPIQTRNPSSPTARFRHRRSPAAAQSNTRSPSTA
jgi:hypothetical protein